MEFRNMAMNVAKLFCVLTLSIAISNGKIVVQEGCKVSEFRYMMRYSPQIRLFEVNCQRNEDGLVPFFTECEFYFQCPLDEQFSRRRKVATCSLSGFWEYEEPTCEDNIKKLQDLEAAILGEEEEEDTRPVPVRLQGFRPAVLKSIIVKKEDLEEAIVPETNEKEEDEIDDEQPTNSTMEESNEDDENPTAAEEETVAETTKVVDKNVTEVANKPVTKVQERKASRTTLATRNAMLAKLKLAKHCRANQMCKWAAAAKSCNIFGKKRDKESIRIFQKLCQACVANKICKSGTVVLFGGSQG